MKHIILKRIITILICIMITNGFVLAQQSSTESNPEVDEVPQENRLENLNPISKGELPDIVINSFEKGYFSDWKITEIYKTENMEGAKEIPADYIIMVEKNNTIMYLFYSGNGELIMQETQDLPITEVE